MTVNPKQAAAEKAVDDFIADGMTVGLGTGSTAYYAIKRVGELVKKGFRLKCVATSAETERIARECGIFIVSIDDVDRIDVTIDGADEVDPEMNLIKGLGGALLREKIVASASASEVIIIDDSKLVEKLGTKCPVPVEVLVFGHSKTKKALERQGCDAALRVKDGKPFITDSGNYIYDCKFDSIDNPFFLESRINVIPGVVDNGLFLNTATAVVISSADGNVRMM
ncbi:MAG: ribose-5-phosphate isomerase RpiA [Methanomassiliicoccaceae archaeon]|nr:ribose-5-phosphate isomerase RpiA [Methanomassiliicoccaceae archaeon]MCL2143626.1 ribose-5-phosphate isomerase RpiA [Methanomassiliicoccaceae archaeon]